MTTIRAYGAQDILQDEFDKHQDLHTSAWYMYIASSCAFGFFLDLMCFIFFALVTFSFVVNGKGYYFRMHLRDFGYIKIEIKIADTFGGQVGLAITQATALTGLIQWGIRQSAEVANQLMSVERVLEYTELPPEDQPVIPKNPQTEWPHSGKISFRNTGMRYAESEPLVLKNLDITIQPKDKVCLGIFYFFMS